MKELKSGLSFYLLPLVVIQLINLIIYFLFDAYLEEYEGFFSTAIEGIYTQPAKVGWDSDTHFILIYLYSYLANYTTDFNIYGCILFLYNWTSLTFIGCVLYRILSINLTKRCILFFVLLYAIISIDNMLQLNSVRHAFVFTAAVLAFIESRRFENKTISKLEWLGLSFILIYSALIRFDAVLLFSVIYIILLLIHNRFYRLALIPLMIGISIYLAFNITSAKLSSNEKKVLIFKEREIFDRYNVDYNKLSPLQKLDIDALMQYCITDREHFTLQFYDAISRKNSNKGPLSILNGFNYESVKNTWRISLQSFYKARYYVLFYFLSGLFILLLKQPNKLRYIIQYIFLGLIPLLLCFYTIIPLRFLIPFFTVTGCINTIICLKSVSIHKFMLGFCFVILMFILYDGSTIKNIYQLKTKEYDLFCKRLEKWSQMQIEHKPVVINSVYPINYFPVKALSKLPKQNAVFLNFYLFSADDYQIKTWKALCNCNTFSLKERVDYIVANQNLFLIDSAAFSFMKNYFSEKYKIQLQQHVVGNFDEHLNVSTLRYSNQ